MAKFVVVIVIIILFQFRSVSQNFINGLGIPLNTSVNSISGIDEKSDEYLVVFKSPCLIQQLQENSQLKSASMFQLLQNDHARFVADLSKIRKSNSTNLKSASTPIIKQELFRTINAVIVESNDEEIAKIKTFNYVKTILKNEKIQLIKETISENRLKSASNVTTGTSSENGEGVKVGIIDTGIDYNNPALGGGFGPGFKVAGGYDFVNNDKDPMDDSGHGTSVAGVIAADGELTGIAPKATLYAYKTQDTGGWGWSNNVFKALEHCVDPNQDFDFSDHLDIINMSFGTYEMAEQELEIFSDIYEMMANLKIIVCVGAGNEGPDYLRFNKFSESENVLSVGSCNSNNEISTFSSRGFGINNYGIKPDIVAIGENVKLLSLVNSTGENGGTSIACPGVAGVAAILKQKHKDWTYNQLKSALMNSADDLGFNVMEQGAGKINRNAALNQTTVVFPQTINLGIASDNNEIINNVYSITIFNKSGEQQSYSFDFGNNMPQGIDFKANPSSLIINSNDSLSVTINLSLDQSQLSYPDQIPYNFFGRINVNGTKDSLSILWTLLRGCEIKVKSDIKFSDFSISSLSILKNGQQINPFVPFETSNSVVVSPGKYDILFKATEGNFGYPWTDTIKSYFYIKENVPITEQFNLNLSKAEIKNKVKIESVDENGNQLCSIKLLKNQAALKPLQTSYDFLAIKSKSNSLDPILINYDHDEYYINDFGVSDNYKLYAGDSKTRIKEKADFFVTNYEVNQEIKNNLILKNLPSSRYPYAFIFYPFPTKKSNYSISGGTHWGGTGNNEIQLDEITKATLWIDKKKEDLLDMSAFPMLSTKDSLDRFEGHRMFDLIYSYGDSIQIKNLRYDGREEFQTIFTNDTVFVNNGPVYFSLNIIDRFNYKYFGCYSYLKGMYGEYSDYGFSESSISVFGSNDKMVYKNTIGKFYSNPYTGSLDGANLEISTSDYCINGKQGKALLKYELKANPPGLFTSIQSLQFLNHLNQIRSIYSIGSSARMNLVVNNAYETNSIKLFFKLSDETEWKTRSFSLKKNLFNENIIDADITELLTKSIGIDFKIETEDIYGNKMVYKLEPAIVIGDYHENHDFKLHEMRDTTALKNTIIKKKLEFNAYFPKYNLFNWSNSVIEGSGTVELRNDSVFIIPSTDFVGKLTIQIKGVDGQEKDSISVTAYFNEINNSSFYVHSGFRNGDLVGQIGTKYSQENIHYSLSGDSLSIFSFDSMTGKLYVKNNSYLNYSDRRQINLEVVASDGVKKNEAQIIIYIETKPAASDIAFEIIEGNTVGTSIGFMKASDEDGDSISFKIISGNINNAFAINSKTGELSLNSSGYIDCRITPKFELKCLVSDGKYEDEFLVEIIVKTKPVASDFNFEVIQGKPKNTFIGFLNASDDDGDTLSYSFLSGNTNDLFALNKSTGAILINKDNELVGGDIFTLKWQASDGKFTSEAFATINVLVPTSAKIENLNVITFYPNPTRGIIYFDNILFETKIEVFNLSGEKLTGSYLISDSGSTNLDLSLLQSGIYFMKIMNKTSVKSFKIVKL